MIRKLEDMCHDVNFNIKEAYNIVKQIDIDQKFASNIKYGFSDITVLQKEAVDNNNIRMLSFLLNNGSDPNLIYDDQSVLWDLQYAAGETEEENELRLKMAQELLEYGANPNMNPEDGPEDLFDWVWFDICEDEKSDSWEYLCRFFILLVAYGGKANSWSPRIVKEFNKTNMKQYSFEFLENKTSECCAVIVDNKKKVVAYI